MLFRDPYRLLPYLIFFSLMKPDSWLHWTAFGFLVFLLQNKEDWNLRLLPCIVLAILPSLYMSQISWSLALAVLLSFPLGLKPQWIQPKHLLVIIPPTFAMLAFFAGPLAPVAVVLALILFLPRRMFALSVLLFLLLLALPLGRSDWKSWLGQVSPYRPQVVSPSQPTQSDKPLPVVDSTPAPVFADLPLERMVNFVFQALLLLMFSLLLAVAMRLLWLMRKDRQPIIRSLLMFFLIVGFAISSIYFFSWLGRVLAGRVAKDPDLPPLSIAPGNPLPLPGSELPPLQELPGELASEALRQNFPLRELLSSTFTLVLLVVICLILFKTLRFVWQIRSLEDTETPPEDPALVSTPAGEKQDWTLLQGEALLKQGYEKIRHEIFPLYSHLTPYELEQKEASESFHSLSQTYISVAYAREKLEVKDQVLLKWLKHYLTKK
jgi:hypothetical protein